MLGGGESEFSLRLAFFFIAENGAMGGGANLSNIGKPRV